jgi:hypothetical protein
MLSESLRNTGSPISTFHLKTKGSDNMKKLLMVAIAAGLFTTGGVTQTAAGGSAAGNASVTPGQASAGANASQSAQTPGAAANVDTSANARASHDNDGKKQTSAAGAKGGASSSAGAEGSHGVAAGLNSGTSLQAELTKSVDAKKAKPGDEVTAKLTQDARADGKVVMHKGSKLLGHVTEAQAKSKENAESKLGIVFDKAVLKGGEEVAFSGVIQALAPPVQGTASLAGDENSSLGSGLGSGGSGMGGGHSSGGGAVAPIGAATSAASSTLGSTAGAAGNTVGSVAGSASGAVNGTVNRTAGVAANGTLTTAAHGVVGMQGLVLNPAAAGSAQGSVLSSAKNNVKLDSGTQLILQVAGSAAAQ